MLKFGFCLKFGFSFAVIFAIFLEWLGFGFDFIDFLLVRKKRASPDQCHHWIELLFK